ncbi:MAG: TerB family tellurite resistance protein [Myxococcota bacterium]
MSIKDLPKESRLKLMGFVCSFAWADLEIQDGERAMVRKLVKQLELEPDEAEQVEEWLEVPPRAEDLDPNDIPHEHRQVFLSVALQMVGADGVVDQAEMENLSLLEQLLR